MKLLQMIKYMLSIQSFNNLIHFNKQVNKNYKTTNIIEKKKL